jgi:hypothetical protein
MCLFSPNTDALMPIWSHPTPDRAADQLGDGTPATLSDDFISLLGPSSVRSQAVDKVKYATDASRINKNQFRPNP